MSSQEEKSSIGEINVFVSHAWHIPFATTVEAIQTFEEEVLSWRLDQMAFSSSISLNSKGESTRQAVISKFDMIEDFRYFVDIVAINQHNPYSDLAALRSIIEKCHVTLLVLTP